MRKFSVAKTDESLLITICTTPNCSAEIRFAAIFNVPAEIRPPHCSSLRLLSEWELLRATIREVSEHFCVHNLFFGHSGSKVIFADVKPMVTN